MTDRPDRTDAEGPVPSATIVIEAFGGIRPMAAKLDIPVTTVQGWKERDSIPKRRWASIRRVAAERGADPGCDRYAGGQGRGFAQNGRRQ
jgi:hypothetical protein